MSKFANLVRMIVLLKSKGRIKSRDLAASLGISERMVRKYVNDLLEAGINVQSIPGPTGGYELNGYEYLLNINLTDQEYTAFKIFKEQVNTDNIELKQYLDTFEEKLEVQRKSNKEYKDFSSNVFMNAKVGNLELQNNIELCLYQGIIQNKKINMTYTSVSSGNSTRVIHPYKIITRSDFKYVLAYCEKSDDIRIFKLVRISKLDVLDEKFEMPEDDEINKYIKSNKLGIVSGEDIKVKLLIKSPFSYTVKERIYAPNQKITENDDESIIFEAILNGKEDIIRWILSMKSSVSILKPQSLKEEVKNELIKMIDTI